MTTEELGRIPIKLEVMAADANLILVVLQKHPFEEVNRLWNSIREQAVAQVDATVAALSQGKE